MNISKWIQNDVSFTDASFNLDNAQKLTYRIKWIDNEDHYRYSDPQTLVSELGTDIFLSPNPANDQFELISPWPWQQISVYDVAGHVMAQEGKSSSRSISFNTKSWPSGVYFCEQQSETGQRVVKKMVIRH